MTSSREAKSWMEFSGVAVKKKLTHGPCRQPSPSNRSTIKGVTARVQAQDIHVWAIIPVNEVCTVKVLDALGLDSTQGVFTDVPCFCCY